MAEEKGEAAPLVRRDGDERHDSADTIAAGLRAAVLRRLRLRPSTPRPSSSRHPTRRFRRTRGGRAGVRFQGGLTLHAVAGNIHCLRGGVVGRAASEARCRDRQRDRAAGVVPCRRIGKPYTLKSGQQRGGTTRRPLRAVAAIPNTFTRTNLATKKVGNWARGSGRPVAAHRDHRRPRTGPCTQPRRWRLRPERSRCMDKRSIGDQAESKKKALELKD